MLAMSYGKQSTAVTQCAHSSKRLTKDCFTVETFHGRTKKTAAAASSRRLCCLAEDRPEYRRVSRLLI